MDYGGGGGGGGGQRVCWVCCPPPSKIIGVPASPPPPPPTSPAPPPPPLFLYLCVKSNMVVIFFAEVICQNVCIRDSSNVYVRFFLKPQGKFHDENMQNNYFYYILTARLISRHQQPLSRFLLAFTIK